MKAVHHYALILAAPMMENNYFHTVGKRQHPGSVHDEILLISYVFD